MIPPAPPQKRHFLVAALAWTLFISYGSLVPLEFTPIEMSDAVERFRSLPAPSFGLGLRSDVATNVLIFIPLTFLGMGALATDRGSAWRIAASVACAPLALVTALALEFSQLWFHGRTPSTTDITAETSGGVVGILLWIIVGQAAADWLRTYARDRRPRSRAHRLLAVYTLGFVIFTVMPLDLTISVTELYQKYRAGRVLLVPFSYSYDSPLGILYQFSADVLLFVPVGAWLAVALRERLSGWHPVAIGAAAGALLAAVVEFVQLLVISRYTDTTDILLGTIGCAFGAWLVARDATSLTSSSATGSASRLRWFPIGLAIGTYSVFLMVGFWLPFDISLDPPTVRNRLETFYTAPFVALYWSSPFNALTQMLLRLLLFAPLGAIWAFAAARVRIAAFRRLLHVVAILYSAAIALTVEVGQILMPSRSADLTEVFLGTLGALVGLLVTAGLVPPACPDAKTNAGSSGPHSSMPSRSR